MKFGITQKVAVLAALLVLGTATSVGLIVSLLWMDHATPRIALGHLVLATLAFLPLAIGVAIFLARLLVQPLRAIAAAAAELAAGRDAGRDLPAARRDEIGTVARAFATMTARIRQRSAELEQAREAALEASQAKSEFLARMSHEIRTPLHAILGTTELLQRTELSTAQRTHLNRLQHAGDTLLTVINDTLDLAKIEAGRLELNAAPFDVTPFLERAAGLVAVSAHAKGLKLDVDLSAELPARLLGDEDRLSQVLINLLSNAIKFTDAGFVRLRARQESGGGGQSCLHLSVSDSGIGIDASNLERIFESFTQVDSSLTRARPGTGLGLSISRNLVNRMGGRIWAESRQGRGSTFHVKLPLPVAEGPLPAAVSPLPPAAATAAARPPTLASVADGTCGAGQAQPLRVLVAEDSVDNQEILRGLLADMPCEIEVAADGRAAVAAYRRGEVDLVLMDVQMPVLDGHGAIREIREWEAVHGLAPVPIVALTAHALAEDRARSVAAGADCHLAKPLRRGELIATVRRLTSRDVRSGAVSGAGAGCAGELRARLPEYLARRRDDLARLRAACAAGDFATVQMLGHRLKGHAGSYGLDALGTVGSELERAGAQADSATLPLLLDRLERLLATTSTT